MKKPSNTSTQGGIVSHSSRSKSMSDHYHSIVIEPVKVAVSKMKATRSEHQQNSDQDFSERIVKI